MTENEALNELELNKPFVGSKALNNAIDMAIQALEEIQQYRAIGTVEECNLNKVLADKRFEYFFEGMDLHECIDEMIAMFGVEAVKHFCMCNVYKYRYRASAKNGQEDLDKADWYMDKLMELGGAE